MIAWSLCRCAAEAFHTIVQAQTLFFVCVSISVHEIYKMNKVKLSRATLKKKLGRFWIRFIPSTIWFKTDLNRLSSGLHKLNVASLTGVTLVSTLVLWKDHELKIAQKQAIVSVSEIISRCHLQIQLRNQDSAPNNHFLYQCHMGFVTVLPL